MSVLIAPRQEEFESLEEVIQVVLIGPIIIGEQLFPITGSFISGFITGFFSNPLGAGIIIALLVSYYLFDYEPIENKLKGFLNAITDGDRGAPNDEEQDDQ